MVSVMIALLPATFVGIYLFGAGALNTLITAIISSLLFEYFFLKVTGKSETIYDGSALLSGLLLGLNLPPSFPWWGTVVGSFFAIIVVKQLFGGLGFNIFNPVIAARVFLLISWPVQMSLYPKPERILLGVDAVTKATPLTAIKTTLMANDPAATINQITDINLWGLFLGNRAGSIGEVSIAALLIGAIYLFYKRTITLSTPLSFILSAAVFSFLFHLINPQQAAEPVFHILNGGLILGAFFMATDYVTSPVTSKGMVIFGVGCGFLTILIRQYGGYPEGVSFAILIMNMFVPLIDRYLKPVKFGAGGPYG